jgi:hypothetical protein
MTPRKAEQEAAVGHVALPTETITNTDVVTYDPPAPGVNSIASSIAAVMAKCHRIPKNGYNQFHKYKFATEADVSDTVRELLAAENVCFMPSVEEVKQQTIQTKSGTATLTTIKMNMRFISGNTGEELVSSWYSEAADNSDKSINKCVTAGVKYFLLKTFLISSGDIVDDADSEGIEVSGRPAPAPKQINPSTDWAAVIQAAVKSKGLDWEKSLSFMRSQGVDPFSMTQDIAKEWIARIEKGPSKKPDEPKAE